MKRLGPATASRSGVAVLRFALLLALAALAGCRSAVNQNQPSAGPYPVNYIVRPLARPVVDTEALLRQAETLAAPAGTSAADWAAILAEFKRSLTESKTASYPPKGDYNNIKDLEGLTLEGGQLVLRWTYVNVGDYDVNSQVNIADLTPVGLHFQQNSTQAGWEQAQYADGDGNGEVNIGDVTPLGQNFGAEVSGYQVLGADSSQGPWTDLGRINFSQGTSDPLPVFYFEVPQWYAWWLISPIDDTPDTPAPGGGGGAIYHPGPITPVVSSTIGSNGGTITAPPGSALEGVSVTIPPDALLGDVQIGLRRQEGSVEPVLGTAVPTILDLDSAQEQFYQPVQITMRYPAGSGWPVPYYIDGNGRLHLCDLQAVDEGAGSCTFNSWHATPFILFVDVKDVEPQGFKGTFITDFEVPEDGFQIGNTGSLYYADGECLGMVAFAQYYHAGPKASGGEFYPRFMQTVGTRTGQQIIATRAHTSIDLLWRSYLPGLLATHHTFVTDTSVFMMLRNAVANTGQPAILHITADFGASIPRHAVLAYAVKDQLVSIYDPNAPGDANRYITLSGSPAGFDTYDSFGDLYNNVFVVGDGSLYVNEPYTRILANAESGFNGSNDAQLSITSHANGANVNEASTLLKGNCSSGDVLVSTLDILVNGSQLVRASFSGDTWAALVPLQQGDNYFEFITRGLVAKAGYIPIPHTFTERFKLTRGAVVPPGNGSLEVQLTRTPSDGYLDLYVTAANGGTWYYLQPAGCDGGLTQNDIWSPQIWFMPAGEHPDCPPPYTVRVHNSGSAPGDFQARITYNRGTASETSTTVNGHIEVGDFFNRDPGSTGPDWADVGVYTPVDP